MYKKILKTMIALVIAFLTGLYVLKIFFPQQFIMTIQNDKIVAIGNYIDSQWWLLEICAFITSFITYWLYLCAVTKKWKLSLFEILIVCIVITITHLIYEFDVNLASGIAIIAMIVLPALFKANIKTTAIVFSVHYMSQALSISIRSLPSLLTNVNYATIFLMMLEGYFWLLLFYLYYNYKKEI